MFLLLLCFVFGLFWVAREITCVKGQEHDGCWSDCVILFCFCVDGSSGGFVRYWLIILVKQFFF